MKTRLRAVICGSVQTSSAASHGSTAHLPIALLLIMLGLVLSMPPADARPIRIDESGTTWTESTPSPETTDPTADVDLGFTFNFFGNMFSQVDISPTGNVSSDGAIIAPFDGDRSFEYAWQFLINPLNLAGGTIVEGFRVCWNCDSREDPETSSFQLGLFDLGGDNFVIEFNYITLLPTNAVADPFLGYNNGDGSVYDLLTTSGLALGGSNDPNCSQSTGSLACNSFFDPALQNFGAGIAEYFTQDPDDSLEEATGRYVFVIANEQPDTGGGGDNGDNGATTPPPPSGGGANGDTQAVPEPATGALLMLGLAALGAAGRRRRRPV